MVICTILKIAITTFLAPQISCNFTLCPNLSHDQLSSDLPKITRPFFRDLFDALNFNSLLNLSRWSRISFYHQRQLIDWKNTWLLLNTFHINKKGRTSFKKSSYVTFSTKLLMDKLPLLHNLQSKRHPDLYDKDWNCVLCGNDKETWLHLWVCPHIKDDLLHLLEFMKDLMFDNTCFSRNSTPDSILNTWDNLSCWQYPTDDTSIFSFESLLRGFVHCDLTSTLALIHNKKGVLEIITESLSTAKQAFTKQIWAYRCDQVQEFEQSLHISHHDKCQSSTRLANPPTTLTSTSCITPPTTN